MSMTSTDDRQKMRDHLTNLIARASSTDPDDAISSESPLSLEVSGKYVNVLFSTGGPHTEFLAEFSDEVEAEFWFENEPVGGWFTYMDWGTREDVYVGRYDAYQIMQAVTRDPETLDESISE